MRDFHLFERAGLGDKSHYEQPDIYFSVAVAARKSNGVGPDVSGHTHPGEKVIKHLRVPWWDSELEVNRKKTRALRSRYQRCRREEERSMRRIVYKKQEADYKWLIKLKCRASFELFCQQLVANNTFDLPYKIATGKIRKQTVLQSVKTSNGQYTNTIEETIQTIVQALFPTDDSTQETHTTEKT
ncbi:hypothetical protein AVEN_241990-1 [Araneus ventricosus]|uniref:Uncharacterized protein n=1 Tax=Araneus ventricosus TaxID=182803 RepID=A0A4Y2ECE4_ARAVE|nr:hypothetical protein AVEN_241990-1 [Araneus ventricosus]